MNIEEIASVCHEANAAYCRALGDHSQPTWEDAPDWQRSSAINGVRFHIENPNSQACDSHNSWLREKLAQGWKYGPVKDADKKEHPCIVDYDQLPEAQQKKDALFLAIVRSLA